VSVFLAGLLLGVAGGIHCMAMCGPLAWLAGRGSSALAYHAGRIATYVGLGLLAGVAGAGAADVGLARTASIVAGITLIAQSVGLPARLFRTNAVGRYLATLERRLPSSFLLAIVRRAPNRPVSRVALGVANGLMPCGLLYAALIAGAGLGRVSDAALFIAGFGVGSLPALAAVTVLTGFLRSKRPRFLRCTMPVALAVAGVMLIARAWPLSLSHHVASAHSTHQAH
jgi:uncharacterized protein